MALIKVININSTGKIDFNLGKIITNMKFGKYDAIAFLLKHCYGRHIVKRGSLIFINKSKPLHIEKKVSKKKYKP